MATPPLGLSRRRFLGAGAAAFAALAFPEPFGLKTALANAAQRTPGYGPLERDPAGLLELPRGFSYQAFSTAILERTDHPRFSQKLDNGDPVPCRHDGMAAFAGPGGITVLVRNHEINTRQWPIVKPGARHYDPKGRGGTTTLWVNADNRLKRSFVSLSGTFRNCAGGTTPWGSWLTCEECTYMPGAPDDVNDDLTPEVSKPHGYMFEVDASAEEAVEATPIRAMGRFYHEAAAVDPQTAFVYMTEDRWDGLIYRFRPNLVTQGLKKPSEMRTGDLNQGGTLEALRIVSLPMALTQNTAEQVIEVGKPYPVDWVTIPVIEPAMDMERVPEGDALSFRPRTARSSVRAQGFALGAAQFALGEGMVHQADSIFFACSRGGRARAGQIWRLELTQQTLTLISEPNEPSLLEGPDNLALAPNGDLLICEDGRGSDSVIGLTGNGLLYALARNAYNQSELAGACFSPAGDTLFLNMQDPGITFAIRGPWESRR